MHPLVRLWRYAGAYRTRIRLAVLYTVINKLFDILPEVLIGVAVDVVVRTYNAAPVPLDDPGDQRGDRRFVGDVEPVVLGGPLER